LSFESLLNRGHIPSPKHSQYSLPQPKFLYNNLANTMVISNYESECFWVPLTLKRILKAKEELSKLKIFSPCKNNIILKKSSKKETKILPDIKAR
jgi:hypothetical protein